MNPDKIVRHFAFEGHYISFEPYKKGHINDTYIVSFEKDDGKKQRYIMQRINHQVFKNPPRVMENIEKVTSHLRKKIIECGGNPERETLTLIPPVEGCTYYKTPDGHYWRAYDFIENAHSFQVVKNPLHFYHAGKVVGRFQQLLGDFPVDSIYETIPDFHNTPKRFADFTDSVHKDKMNRAKSVEKEIKFVENRAGELPVLVDLLREGRLPLRVIHNDTKFNNVLIDDKTGEGICLVDLDTVMPGLSLYDFGDAIRFGASTAEEDERDLSRVNMDIELFKEFSRGYMETAGSFLTPLEIECLPFSAWLITLECGIRFLTDHLNGDIYFKTHRENHNLHRARTQLKLVEHMERKFEQMESVLKNSN